MSDKITGYTEATPKAMTTGAAVVFKDFNLATDTAETAEAKILGATSGGVSVKVAKETWSHEIDGLPENTKGNMEIESVMPTVEFELAEVSSVNALSAALGAAESKAAAKPDGYIEVSTKDLTDADYFQNLTLITRTKVGNTPLIIVIDNPLNQDDLEVSTEYKAGGRLKCTFTGNYNPLDVNKHPVRFYVPTNG